MRVFAILPAAGRSARMGGAESKLMLSVAGKPVLAWVLETLASIKSISNIVIPARSQDWDSFSRNIPPKAPCILIPGGDTRQESVRNALRYLHEDCLAGEEDKVLVHDAARCCVSAGLIERCIAAAESRPVLTTFLPETDTVRLIDPQGRLCEGAPDRSSLVRIQTPQVFNFKMLHEAHSSADEQYTDDAGLFIGKVPVGLVEGEISNIKVTSPQDIGLAESILTARGSHLA